MKQSLILWVVAFIITVLSALYQFMTGPSYPARGSLQFNGKQISYTLNRSHAGSTNCPVVVTTNDESVQGVLEWKRYKSDDPWTSQKMTFQNNTLVGELPAQPPAGKLEYHVKLSDGTESQNLPENESVVVRFHGDIPPYILIPHILAMFGGMFLSARTGIESLRKNPNLKKLIIVTVMLLLVGGFILGPIVQWFAFNAFWTGWPLGHDLTDNKTAVAIVAWIVALAMLKRSKKPHRWALGAAIVTLVVYLIPHSVLGSEIEYKKVEQNTTTLHTVNERAANLCTRQSRMHPRLNLYTASDFNG
ncbi:MAG: hypothetical protein ACHQQQ_02465 [Bacteroidota bacterium]